MIRSSRLRDSAVMALTALLLLPGCAFLHRVGSPEKSTFSIVPVSETTFEVNFEAVPLMSRQTSAEGLLLNSATLTLDQGGRFFRLRNLHFKPRYWSVTSASGPVPAGSPPVPVGASGCGPNGCFSDGFVADVRDRAPHGSLSFDIYYDVHATVETFVVRPEEDDGVFEAEKVIEEITGAIPGGEKLEL